MPPTSSTKMSASEERSSLMFSVQPTLGDTQSTFFRSILRLKICVNSKLSFASWHRSFATDRPTVPKPASAILNFLLADSSLPLDCTLGLDFAFARFAFAANDHLARNMDWYASSFETARIIRYFGMRSRETAGLFRMR